MSVLSFLFKEKEEEYQRKINELEKKLKDKTNEIDNLITDLEKANNRISSKQFTVIERNIKENQEKASKYSKIIKDFGLNPDKKYYKYKLEISKFYSGSKFSEINKILTENEVIFLDDLSEIKFYSLLENAKNTDEAKKRFLDFKNGKYDWETATLLNRGDKLSKIYSSRKLLNIFSDLFYEYIDDIDNFDFSILKSYNFNSSQIETYKNKRNEYYKERRIEQE